MLLVPYDIFLSEYLTLYYMYIVGQLFGHKYEDNMGVPIVDFEM